MLWYWFLNTYATIFDLGFVSVRCTSYFDGRRGRSCLISLLFLIIFVADKVPWYPTSEDSTILYFSKPALLSFSPFLHFLVSSFPSKGTHRSAFKFTFKEWILKLLFFYRSVLVLQSSITSYTRSKALSYLFKLFI